LVEKRIGLFNFHERSDERKFNCGPPPSNTSPGRKAAQHRSLFAVKLRRKIMINKAKLTLIAAIAASSIALPAAALAQSAYTTGTAASRAAAGYPSPYGYGSGLYAYAPNHVYGRRAWGR
jgi:hypothetical protein